MKSLYESIIGSNDAGRESIIWEAFAKAINKYSSGSHCGKETINFPGYSVWQSGVRVDNFGSFSVKSGDGFRKILPAIRKALYKVGFESVTLTGDKTCDLYHMDWKKSEDDKVQGGQFWDDDLQAYKHYLIFNCGKATIVVQVLPAERKKGPTQIGVAAFDKGTEKENSLYGEKIRSLFS